MAMRFQLGFHRVPERRATHRTEILSTGSALAIPFKPNPQRGFAAEIRGDRPH